MRHEVEVRLTLNFNLAFPWGRGVGASSLCGRAAPGSSPVRLLEATSLTLASSINPRRCPFQGRALGGGSSAGFPLFSGNSATPGACRLPSPGASDATQPLAEGVLESFRERILKRRNLIRRDARAVDLRPLWRLERGPLRRGVCARAGPRALSLAGGVARLDDEVGVTRATRGTDSGAATAERNDAARHGVADKRCGSTDRERQRRHHQTMARGTAKTKIEPCSRCFARRGARSRGLLAEANAGGTMERKRRARSTGAA